MSYAEILRNAMRPANIKGAAVLDSCGEKQKKEKNPDTALDAAGDYAANDIAMKAAASVQQWAETDDLDEGETQADRLLALMVGIADANKDGELTDEENDVVQLALSAAFDYLTSHGVDEDDAEKLLNNWDPATAERVRDMLAASLPDGEDASDADLDNFVFSDEDQESAFDSCLDAVYRKTFAIRGGKKVRINKRISGTVRLSAKQKLAIRKASMKSHSAGAMMRRMKSMRLRKKMGL